MEKKKVYEAPEMNMITFQAEDVIRTSNETDIVPGDLASNSFDEIDWHL